MNKISSAFNQPKQKIVFSLEHEKFAFYYLSIGKNCVSLHAHLSTARKKKSNLVQREILAISNHISFFSKNNNDKHVTVFVIV